MTSIIHRRAFFAAIAAAAIATPSLAETPPLRSVYRKVGDQWQRCRMYELKVGDVMKIVFDASDSDTGEVFVGRVTTPPAKDGPHWGCQCEVMPAE